MGRGRTESELSWTGSELTVEERTVIRAYGCSGIFAKTANTRVVQCYGGGTALFG